MLNHHLRMTVDSEKCCHLCLLLVPAAFVLTDLNVSVFPCGATCPDPDPEDLCAFTSEYGSLRLLLSFQVQAIEFDKHHIHLKVILVA